MQLQTPKSDGLPAGLSIEAAATNLASLATTPALRELTDTVLRQWRSRDAFAPLARYGIHPIRQLLFHGPPGNGKTSACQWIASQIDVPLYRVRCEQLVEAYLGRTAANVAGVMQWIARQGPAVVLFDEVESLFPSRADGSGACSREMSSAMTVYWQWMDRWKKQHLFVLATNMVDRLDPALVSRIEMSLEFGPPTDSQCRQVIGYWAETLHEYGVETWGPALRSRIDDGDGFESFRDLWHAIRSAVSTHVSQSLTE